MEKINPQHFPCRPYDVADSNAIGLGKVKSPYDALGDATDDMLETTSCVLA